MSEPQASASSFTDFALPQPLLQALAHVGYERPTPIQAQTLPALIDGRDLLGHAPTGTGKTAAFALPALARLHEDRSTGVRVLVLTPTRELAIQVAEAFTSYASRMPDFRVLPIYGGQDYTTQIRQLKRGVQVVVGTPGRVMDHLRRGTLQLDNLQTLVLDEADEMLRMGFIDDVEWILEQTPAERQTALFSATMPRQIERIASKHLKDPMKISIEGKRETAAAIHQRVWVVSGMQKLDALTRILEVERFDGMLIFVRTRTLTTELADKLGARGFAAAAINGDMVQKQREQTVEKLKRGSIDILVATDVVARGLDVDRISHVINYDIPHDTEAYVHRIGRTGRAGRSGEAILFVAPRERGLLGAIERATASKIEPMMLPTIEAVNERRVADFRAAIDATLEAGTLGRLQTLVEAYADENDVPMPRVAAALAQMALGERPLYAVEERKTAKRERKASRDTREPQRRERAPVAANPRTDPSAPSAPLASTASTDTPERVRDRQPSSRESRPASREPRPKNTVPMEGFRVEIGSAHGVQAGHLVGAIANEAGIDSAWIGRIRIEEQHSEVELPVDMPKPVLRDLRQAWVLGRRLAISRLSDAGPGDDHTAQRNRAAAAQASERPKHRGPAGSGNKPSGKRTGTGSGPGAGTDAAGTHRKGPGGAGSKPPKKRDKAARAPRKA